MFNKQYPWRSFRDSNVWGVELCDKRFTEIEIFKFFFYHLPFCSSTLELLLKTVWILFCTFLNLDSSRGLPSKNDIVPILSRALRNPFTILFSHLTTCPFTLCKILGWSVGWWKTCGPIALIYPADSQPTPKKTWMSELIWGQKTVQLNPANTADSRSHEPNKWLALCHEFYVVCYHHELNIAYPSNPYIEFLTLSVSECDLI